MNNDAGLPGGVSSAPCDCGPCPDCADERGVSEPCAILGNHGSDHRCAQGHFWEQVGASDQRKFCGSTCQTNPCGKTCTRKFLHTPPHMCPLGHTWT